MPESIKYKIEVDDKDAEKKIDEMSSKFEDAFNAGRAFSGTSLQLKKMMNETSSYIRQLKKEYQDTAAALEGRGANPKKSKALQQLRDDIKAAESELEGLRENMKDRRLSSENIFQGLAQGAQGLMGAFTAVQGAAAMFGAEEEKLAKIQTKLQASMSILMGLQRAGNLLNSQSQFRVQVMNKLQEAWHKWNLKVAASEGIKKAAMLGVVGAIALAIAGITALIIKFSKYNDEVQRAKELQKEWKQGFVSSATSQIATLTKLSAEWKATNGNIEEQKKLVARNKSEFEDLGYAVNTVKQAEDLLVTNKEAVVKSILERARAAAYLAQVNTLVAKSVELEAQMEAKRDNGDYKANWWQRNVGGTIAGLMTASSVGVMMDKGVIDPNMNAREIGWDILKKGFQQGKEDFIAGKEYHKEYKDEKKMKEIEEELEKAGENYAKALTGGTQLAEKKYREEQAKHAAAIAQAQLQLFETLRKNQREELRLEQDLRKQIMDADIAAMEEGYEKRAKLREAANRKEIDDLERAKDDYIEAAKNRAKAEFDAEEALKKAKDQNYVVKTFDPSSVSVDTSYYDKLIDAVKKRQQADNRKRILDENSDFVREYNKLMDEFYGKKHELSELGLDPDEYSRALKKLLQITEDEMVKFAQTLASSYEDGDFSKWAERVTKMGLDELKTELQSLETQFSEISGTTDASEESMVKLQAAIALVRRAIRDFGGEDTTKAFRDWSQAIELMRDTFNDLGEEIGGTFGEITKSIGSTLSRVQSVRNDMQVLNSSTASSADKMSAKMNIVSTAISGTIELIGMYIKARKEAEQAEKDWQNALTQTEHKLAMLNLAEYAYKKRNIFGVENPYAKAIAGAEQYAAAVGELSKAEAKWADGEVQVGTKRESVWENILKGMGTGAATGAAVGTIAGGWAMGTGTAIGAAIGAVVGGIVGAASTKVVPIMESLTKKYGSLYDENYVLNKQLVADYDILSDETKQIVDNWDEIVEKIKEAEEEMRENFADLAGDLGDKLSDRLVAAFTSGKITAAMGEFKGDVTEMMESIVSQQIFSNIFGALFDDLENEMMASFGAGGDQDLVDDIMRFDRAYQDRLAAYEEQMKAAQEYYESQGYDLWKEERTRSSATKAISGVSQESFDDMSGRVTSIQLSAYNIDETTKALREQQGTLLSVTSSILFEVQGIHADTQALSEKIDTMSGELALVRSGVGTITDKGVRMLN